MNTIQRLSQHRSRLYSAKKSYGRPISPLINENNSSKGGYFAVYDGHGGRATVNFLKQSLHKAVNRELKQGKKPLEAISTAVLSSDALMSKNRIYLESGSTVACVLIIPSSIDSNKRDLYASNVGDTRIVLCIENNPNEYEAIRISKDHNPDKEPSEVERILRSGGFVVRGRVNGQLAVSRALGDYGLKSVGVCAIPYQTHISLTNKHKFIIIGCDGLFDVISDQEAVDAIANMKHTTAKKMAEKLVRIALERNTTDNVSVIVIRLRK